MNMKGIWQLESAAGKCCQLNCLKYVKVVLKRKKNPPTKNKNKNHMFFGNKKKTRIRPISGSLGMPELVPLGECLVSIIGPCLISRVAPQRELDTFICLWESV